MKEKYGNSFGSSSESMKLATYTPWIRVDEFYPGGAMVKPGELNGLAPGSKYRVGDKIPVGTPIYMEGLGSSPFLGNDSSTDASNPTPNYEIEKAILQGLTYEDAYVGEEGCSLTIVTRGTLKNEDLEKPFTSKSVKEEIRNIGITIV